MTEMTDQQDLRAAISIAIDYSHNFATAKPDIGATEKEHILGLVALLREAAAQLGRVGEPVAHAVYARSEEYGPVLLPDYVGSMEVIRRRVIEAARREGFKGDFVQRMADLGWWIEPLCRWPHPSSSMPACESGQPECGPVEFHDCEGVPLCRVCWEGLIADSAIEDSE